MRLRQATFLAVLVLLTMSSLSGCSRSRPSMLWVKYECEFVRVDGEDAPSDKDLVKVGIDLGSGRSIIAGYDTLVDVNMVPDAGRLVLRYPSEAGRQLAIWPDGRAILSQPQTPGKSDFRDHELKCARL